MKKVLSLGLPFGLLIAAVLPTFAGQASISVRVDQPGHTVPPTLWGIFFEDINLSTDGGLYPELVRNRSFEDGDRPESWKLIKPAESATEIKIDDSHPLNPLNRHSLRVQLNGPASLVNEGFWGMNLVQDGDYTLRLAARTVDNFRANVGIRVKSGASEIAREEIRGITGDWKYYTVKLHPSASAADATLQLDVAGQGALFLDMVSLLPVKTWKDHGLRTDLAEAVDALHPAFLRFPGGCWVEGETLARMYNWKKTVGAIDVRTPLFNIWDYHATHGIGFHEYLQLAEDLGAEPLFCVNVGMSHRENAPMDLINQWVQDALDAIEYANGPTNSVWGGLRARNGRPAPFHLRYLEIGNENGGPAYNERWPLFVQAIKARHPEIQLVANHWLGTYPRSPMPDIVDEHYYDTPEWFMQHADHYDSYDRNGPKIFVGEYAVTRNTGLGNLRGALGEAAFMTGLERNSDLVAMASYAPLFCNANHKRWPINLINFDSSRWFGIPSYYVQKLFAENRGSITLPTRVTADTQEEPLPRGGIGVGTWNTSAEFKDLKVTSPDGKVLLTDDFSSGASGWKKLGDGQWAVQDGALRQTAEREFVRALAGDRSWTDYTLELKARKIFGREGFLILFHAAEDEDRIWWNLGGWNNTRHGVEIGQTLDPKAGRIETGRWYDIKVEVNGNRVRCSLDGQIVHDVQTPRARLKSVFASATRDNASGEIILKVVNAAATATETEINLSGARKLARDGKAIILTSASAKDENTLDAPTRVAPRTELVAIPGERFSHAFPGNSFTVLRIPAEK